MSHMSSLWLRWIAAIVASIALGSAAQAQELKDTGGVVRMFDLGKAAVDLRVLRDNKPLCELKGTINGNQLSFCPLPAGQKTIGRHKYIIKGIVRYRDGSVKSFNFVEDAEESEEGGCFPTFLEKDIQIVCG